MQKNFESRLKKLEKVLLAEGDFAAFCEAGINASPYDFTDDREYMLYFYENDREQYESTLKEQLDQDEYFFQLHPEIKKYDRKMLLEDYIKQKRLEINA